MGMEGVSVKDTEKHKTNRHLVLRRRGGTQTQDTVTFTNQLTSRWRNRHRQTESKKKNTQ